jgi:maleylacetate reductase
MEGVRFGAPAAEAVAREVERLGAVRVFLMVSGTLARTTEAIDQVRRALGNRCAGVFDHMPPHTPRRAVIEAAAAARAAGADLIATIGGGSVTDGAKAVQLCLANEIRSAEALDDYRPAAATGGAPIAPGKEPSVRQITVPTTLYRARIQRHCRHYRRAPPGQGVVPPSGDHPARGDPRSGRHRAAWLWLSTGIRAVDHCVEGHGPGCRWAPLASGVPMGASHGIGYVLGAAFDIPHGHTSCIMLPAVMRWNKPANAARQQLVAAAMGHPGEDAGDGLHRRSRHAS